MRYSVDFGTLEALKIRNKKSKAVFKKNKVDDGSSKTKRRFENLITQSCRTEKVAMRM